MIPCYPITRWSRLRSAALAMGLGMLAAACAGPERQGPPRLDRTVQDDAGDPFAQIDQVEVLSLDDIKERAQQLANDLDLQGAERDVAVIQSQFDQIYPSLQRLLIIEEDIRKLLVTLGDLPADQLGLDPDALAPGPQGGQIGAAASQSQPASEGNAAPVTAAPQGAAQATMPAIAVPDLLSIGSMSAEPPQADPPRPEPVTPPEPVPARPAPAQTMVQAPQPDRAPSDDLFDPDFGGTAIPVTDIPMADGAAGTTRPPPRPSSVSRPASAPVAGGTWGVHVGSYELEDSARRDLVLMRRDLGTAMRGLDARLVPIPGQGSAGSLRRLVLGPFGSRSAAKGLCEAFEAAGRFCAPIPFGGSRF